MLDGFLFANLCNAQESLTKKMMYDIYLINIKKKKFRDFVEKNLFNLIKIFNFFKRKSNLI